MPPKRKSIEYDAPLPIEANFVRNSSIEWIPVPPADSPGVGPSTGYVSRTLTNLPILPSHTSTSARDAHDSSQPSGSRLPQTNEELKQQFAAFIQTDIQARINSGNTGGDGGAMVLAEQIKIRSAIRAVVLDPSSELDGLTVASMRESGSLDTYFRRRLTGYISSALRVIGIWVNKPTDALDEVVKGAGSGETSTTTTKGKPVVRGKADKAAQRTVPTWYQQCCPLTGVEVVDAAHIVDIQAVQSMGSPGEFWEVLQLFWPLQSIQQLKIIGCEEQNILPLQPTAHRLWDRHKFALRPIQHPTDPEHRIYLQVVWFKDRHAEIGLGNDGQRRNKETNLSDRRRKMEDSTGAGARYVVHGDIYELSTSDPEKRPLPDIRYFQMRYAMQQLFAGQQAAGALRAIFGGDPPDDNTPGPARDEAFMPSDWDDMLREALELGILSDKTEAIWRRHILEKAYWEGLQRVWKYRAATGELGSEAEEEY